jgi:hypothetical protein
MAERPIWQVWMKDSRKRALAGGVLVLIILFWGWYSRASVGELIVLFILFLVCFARG